MQERLRTRLGRPAPVRRAGRRLDAPPGDPAAAREAEAALLTDPAMRLRAGRHASGRRHDDARRRPRHRDHDGVRRAARRRGVGLRRRRRSRTASSAPLAAIADLRAQRLAARFAAKEAFVKAWSGARAGRDPALDTVDLREIEVVDDGHGRPALRLHGTVAAALEQLASELGVAAPLRTHVSLSHDPPTAAAVVVLSAP